MTLPVAKTAASSVPEDYSAFAESFARYVLGQAPMTEVRMQVQNLIRSAGQTGNSSSHMR